MTEEELTAFVKARSWPELTTLTDIIEKDRRERRIKYLLTVECNCDRYTCSRCHELYDVLHYNHEKEKLA